jgi:DNA polymerase-3 subunit gamma/tau
MSYLVLARKWRPRRFAELVGQQHVVRALVNGIETGRLHHAFLFTGTRGVGKTTIARILAKALNCETGITSEPCGVCSACKDIDAGRFVDLLEIDAASRTKVDDTRDLLDNVIYAPSRGRYKVYLIDEVHMLSTHSFNALLKTLEEPPPHVKFLLATTDPQKLPVTVLSRCLQFSLKRLERAEIEAQLTRILEAEGLAFEAPAINALARAADGSLRDGLSLLDQALAFGNGAVREGEVLEMLGTIDRRSLSVLATALMSGDRATLRNELKHIAELSVDYPGLLGELLVLWHDIAVRQGFGEDMESELVDAPTLAALAEGLSAEDVQLFYQLTLHARRDLDLAPDHRTGFEMAMLRLLAFRPAPVGAQAPVVTSPQRPPATPARSESAPVRSAPQAAPPPSPRTPPAAVAAEQSQKIAAMAAPTMAPIAPSPPPVATTAAPGDWFELVSQLQLRGPAQQLAAQLKLVDHQGARWRLALAPNAESLNTPTARQMLEAAVKRQLGADAEVEIVVRSSDGGETPAERHARARAERIAQAEQSLQADPALQSITREFGARVLPGSLRLDE